MQEHVFKIYVQDSILAQIIKTCWNANLEIFFAEKILNVAVISIISDILKLFFLIYFILKGLFFLYYFTWCWFVIFMITFFFVDQLFCQSLFSCCFLECWIWDKAWAFLFHLSCTFSFKKWELYVSILSFFPSGIG